MSMPGVAFVCVLLCFCMQTAHKQQQLIDNEHLTPFLRLPINIDECPPGVNRRSEMMPAYVGLIVGDYVEPQVHVMFEELYDMVDAFFVVQSVYELSTGKPRNITQFHFPMKPYMDKVIFGIEDQQYQGNGFSKEHEMRSYFGKMLLERNIRHGIFLSVDADEIISNEALKLLRMCEVPFPILLRVVDFRYSFDWSGGVVPPAMFQGSIGFLIQDIVHRWPHECQIGDFRGGKGGIEYHTDCFENKYYRYPAGGNCGWHMSFFNGPAEVWRKLTSYSHTHLMEFVSDKRNHELEGVKNETELIQKLWKRGIMYDGRYHFHPSTWKPYQEKTVDIFYPMYWRLNDELPKLVRTKPWLYPNFFLDYDTVRPFFTHIHMGALAHCFRDRLAGTTNCTRDEKEFYESDKFLKEKERFSCRECSLLEDGKLPE